MQHLCLPLILTQFFLHLQGCRGCNPDNGRDGRYLPNITSLGGMAELFEDVFQPGQRSNLSRTTSRRRLLVGLAYHACVGGDPEVKVTVEVVTLWQPALDFQCSRGEVLTTGLLLDFLERASKLRPEQSRAKGTRAATPLHDRYRSS